MSRLNALCRNIRLFREHCERSLQASGASPGGLRGVMALRELEVVLEGKRPFRGELMKPLSAFTNLLASGALSREYARLSFGDACAALSEIAEPRGRWRFDPDLTEKSAHCLGIDAMAPGLDRLQVRNAPGWLDHARENTRFILAALEHAPRTKTAIVLGGARAYDLPLRELAERFERLIVVDVCSEAETRGSCERAISDPELASRVVVERFDLTGTYNQFASEVDALVSSAASEDAAVRELDAFLSAYDVPARDVRLCRSETELDFVVSGMLLTQLGVAFRTYVEHIFRRRGYGTEALDAGPLAESLSAFACRLEQHHVTALLTQPAFAVITSDVNETRTTLSEHSELVLVGESRDQLGAPRLIDRLPRRVKPLLTGSWNWLRVVPDRPGAPGALMRVEAVCVARARQPD